VFVVLELGLLSVSAWAAREIAAKSSIAFAYSLFSLLTYV